MVAQSAIVSGAELSRRVEAFIESWVADLIEDPDEHLSQEDFEAFQDGIAVRKLEPDQRLTSQAGRLWAEIVNTGKGCTNLISHDLANATFNCFIWRRTLLELLEIVEAAIYFY
jgi:secreted Zn-dependent insulinase-like peptidase